MKWKVVGWTHYDNSSVMDPGDVTLAEYAAIVDEVRERRYLFSGWDHQNSFLCAPVLSDGAMRTFSERGWGGVMAEAYGYEGPYDYARFAFDLAEESRYPAPEEEFYGEDFHPLTRAELAEVITLEVEEAVFRKAAASPSFLVEEKPELAYLDRGDTLVLTSGGAEARYRVLYVERERREGTEPSEAGCFLLKIKKTDAE